MIRAFLLPVELLEEEREIGGEGQQTEYEPLEAHVYATQNKKAEDPKRLEKHKNSTAFIIFHESDNIFQATSPTNCKTKRKAKRSKQLKFRI
uniref:Uncharacterized protein n=1 Tax=Glossina brevipalpis TaxID=37001 RepID=A0A1A9X0X0_9MUSC